MGELVASDLRPVFVCAVLRDEQDRLRHLGTGDREAEEPFGLDAPLPSAVAVRTGSLGYYPDRRAFDAAFPAETGDVLRGLGLHSLVAVPLPGVRRPSGALVFGWDRPNAIEPADLRTIASIAGYAAQAFARAWPRPGRRSSRTCVPIPTG